MKPIHSAAAWAILPLLLAVPLSAQDAEAGDPRVKSVEAQMALALKPVEADAQKARDAYVAAYKKECQARVKVLEGAVTVCERKIKSAQEVSDKKSAEALGLKLADLKIELAAWKANVDKAMVVRFEEAGKAAVAKQDAQEDFHDPRTVEKLIVGKWMRSDVRTAFVTFEAKGVFVNWKGEKAVWSVKPNGHVEWHYPNNAFMGDLEITGKNSTRMVSQDGVVITYERVVEPPSPK